MISLLVYGRNDHHGYNSHRRVALSLNALAEVLSAPDDEIIFVDYNTPHGLPTLPEAIEDTLTSTVLERLRILRITPEIHDEYVGDRTHLPLSEAHARNAAIRRAHPDNWILSTNTDMVFVPRDGRSLNEIIGGLNGDAYGLPRFEIPEWLWESVPRLEPKTMIDLLDNYGEQIGLDEVTLGHEWIRYDAPGDFQLLRRALIDELRGFDEEMIHGWHVDSNLWRRVYNRLGGIGSVYPALAGYHANHNRTHTVHTTSTYAANDLQTFFYNVSGWEPSSAQDDWGLLGVEIPEVRLQRPDLNRRLSAAAARAASQAGPLPTSDTRTQMNALGYDARHVLPFLLDPLLSEASLPSVGYLGINESTCQMLQAAITEIDPEASILTGETAIQFAEVVVLDLGADTSSRDKPLTDDEGRALVTCLENAVEILARRRPAPRILLINGMSGVWDEWVRDVFDTFYGTFHTRLQSARIKLAGVSPFLRRLSFITRNVDGRAKCKLESDRMALSWGEHADFDGFATGWSVADSEGVLLGSGTASIHFQTPIPLERGAHVVVEMACWSAGSAPDSPIATEIRLDGETLFHGNLMPLAQRISIHGVSTQTTTIDHTLEVTVRMADGGPYSPFKSGGIDPWVRLEGIWISTVVEPGWDMQQAVTAMQPGGIAEKLLRGEWTKTNPYGAWSLGQNSRLLLPGIAKGDQALLELLGHPGRTSQGIRITATGATKTATDVHDLVTDLPLLCSVPLPAPDEAGSVWLGIEPIDPPAPTGEVAELRGIGIRRDAQGQRPRKLMRLITTNAGARADLDGPPGTA